MENQIGPTVKISVSCSKCKYCHSQSYRCQGDSGHDVYCEHPNFEERKRVGDTNWNTPDFCPEIDEGYKRLGIKLTNPQHNQRD